MQLVKMVTMMLATKMARKEGEGQQVLAEEADLQVDIRVEADEMVVGMVEEGVILYYFYYM